MFHVDSRPSVHWFADHIGPSQTCIHAVKSWVHTERSEFQDISVFDTESLGRCLVLDGEVQTFEVDEAIYHESLVLPIGSLHPRPLRGLVIGGGEGATLRDALRVRSLEQIDMVEIDPAMVQTSLKYLTSWHQGSYESDRVNLIHADGRNFLESSPDFYDLIWIDISNPRAGGPATRLFTREFYQLVRSRLAEGGLLAIQADTANPLHAGTFPRLVRTLESVFGSVIPYAAYVPSYCTLWGFALAGATQGVEGIAPEEIDRRIAERVDGELMHYDGLAHRSMFCLPLSLRKAMKSGDVPINTDNAPIQEHYPGHAFTH